MRIDSRRGYIQVVAYSKIKHKVRLESRFQTTDNITKDSAQFCSNSNPAHVYILHVHIKFYKALCSKLTDG